MLLFRALLAFLALPGLVAFVVPGLLALQSRSPFQFTFFGATVFGTRIVTLLWCVFAFYVTGKGTLAPWSPPRRLVTIGLYRFTRNPMYVGVLLVLGGWAILFQSPALALYAGAVAVAFHLRVVLSEEPWLARTHGTEWQAYEASVPRWQLRIPRQRATPKDDA